MYSPIGIGFKQLLLIVVDGAIPRRGETER